ncbi:D-alanyl-D-alanine carboxypeptidase family protein [Agromyces sp. GXS1127]|uniref:M15 family metallopeptidase n=1 Tax=Agromyces sp. GXS1127 TaxID=3424181 RepID=UPI003D31025C
MPAGSSASPRVRRNRLIAAVTGMVLVAAAVVWAIVAFTPSSGSASPTAAPAPSSSPTATPRPAPTATSTPTPVETFDMTAHSIDDPDSIWVVVDKLRPLDPVDHEPSDLVVVPVPHTWEPLMRAEAADAVVKMFRAASDEAGLALASNSAYRSYEAQERVYDNDDELTARPGYSEHQTGLTIDIGPESGHCSLAVCFADTPEGQWLRDNAYRFGFLLRYPADKVEVTGYQFEPWHFRYIGTDLSNEMRETGVTTLEEFFGLPAAPNYA